MPYSAGTVFLDVVPSFHNLQRRAEVEGRGAGKAFVKGHDEALKKMPANAAGFGDESGTKAGDAFSRAFRARMSQALDNVGDVKIDADSSKALREIARLKIELKKFSELSIDVEIDGEAALGQARVFEQRLNSILRDETIDIRTRTNLGAARQELAELQRYIAASVGPTKDQYAQAAQQQRQHSEQRLAEARAAAKAESTMLRDAYRENSNSDAKEALRAAKAKAAITENYENDMRALRARTARERASLAQALAAQTETGVQAVRTRGDDDIVTAQKAIVARYAVEQRLAQSTASERIRAAAKGTAGEIAAAKMARQAVEEADKERARSAAILSAQRVALARLTAAVERQASTAHTDTRWARLAANTGQAANAFRVFNGYLLAAVTVGPLLIPILYSIAAGLGAIAVASIGAIAGIGAMVLGFGGVGTAVQALAGVDKERRKQGGGSGSGDPAKDTRALRDATEALGRAREDSGARIAAAARRQEDAERSLTRAVRDAADAQRDLVDARRQAAEDLIDLNNRLASGVMSEQQAAYDLQAAGYRLNNVLEDDQSSSREKAQAQLAYDQQVQSFKELQIANERLKREVAEANTAGVEGSDRVVAANENVVTSNQAIIDAERDLADARREAAEARVDEARTIADAEQRVADAMHDLQLKSTEAGVAGSAAMDALNEAMRGLTPTARAFAEFLYGLKPFFDDLRAAAQEGLLPGVQNMLQNLIDTYGPDLIKFIGDISGVLGDMFEAAGEALTSPVWRDFFKMMAKYAPIFLQQFGSISGSLLTMIAGVLEAFAPYSKEIGEAFVIIAESMAEWGQNLAGSKGFMDFMDFVIETGPKVFEILGLLFEIILKTIQGLEPYIDDLAEGFLTFLEFLANQDPGTLAAWAKALIGIVVAIQALAGVMSVLAGVGGLLQGVIGIFTTLFGGGGAAAAGGGAAAAGTAAAASNPIGWIVLAVVAAIAAIVGLIWWLKHLYETNEDVRARMDETWQAIQNIFQTAYDVVIGPILRGIVSLIEDWVAPAFGLLGTVISDVWGFIAGIFNVGYQVVSKIFNAIAQIWTFIVAPAFRALYEKTIKPIWEDSIQPIFDAMGRFIEEKIQPAWERGLEALGKLWDGLREMIAAPIRWVIETVINDGLIGAFNSLARNVPGMTPIDPVTIPSGLQPDSKASGKFRDGGILPGYTPGRDVHRFYSRSGDVLDLSGGEPILRPEAGKVLGRGWVDGINQAARGTGVSGVRRFLGGYASGGVLDDFGDAIGNAVAGATDVIGNLLDPIGSLRSIVSGLFRLLPGGDSPFMQAASAIPMRAAEGLGGMLAALFKPGAGPVGGSTNSIDWMVPALRAAFPNIAITSTYRPGAVTAVGTPSYHGMARAVDMSPWMRAFDWISGNYPDTAELLFSPAGRRQILRQGKTGDTSGVTKAMHNSHVHWAYGDGGHVPRLYDQGGQIPPGLSLIANKTQKPEMLLPSDLVDQIMRGAGSGGGVTVELNGDVNGGEYLMDQLAHRLMIKARDAAVMNQLESIGVMS